MLPICSIIQWSLCQQTFTSIWLSKQVFSSYIFYKEVSEELEVSNRRKREVPSCSRWEEGLNRSMLSCGTLARGCSFPVTRASAGPSSSKRDRTRSEPAFPGWSTLPHSWPCKCHQQPRLSMVAAQDLSTAKPSQLCWEKGKEGVGALISYAIFSTTTSHRQLVHLIGDMAEPQAINHSNISMSEFLNLQQYRSSKTECPETWQYCLCHD